MRGSCLCGAVRLEAEPVEMESHACHCEMCRRWSGSAMLAVPVAPGGLRFDDEGPVRVYPSSEWAERAFCGVCGSGIFYRVTAEGPLQGMAFVVLGILDDPDALPLAAELSFETKPSAYAFAGERPHITTADLVAKFGQASA